MTDEKKQLLALAAGDSRAIRIGDTVLYPPIMVGGRAFQFDAWQNGFLFALQKFNGDIQKASEFVGRDVAWGERFISTRKFREFRNAKIQAMSIKAGDVVDWWWEMGLSGAKGMIEWYEGSCDLCHEDNRFTTVEAEGFRKDDMSLAAVCKICLQPITIQFKQEAFRPSREQVQFWSEIGARVSPKIERIHHEFSKENFVFQTEEAGEAGEPDAAH